MEGSISALSIAINLDCPPTVKLVGQADFHSRHKISQAFDCLLDEGHKVICADLRELEYIDSSGLSVLIRCAIKAGDCGGAIELVGASGQVSRVMTICGAATFFKSRIQDMPVCRESESVVQKDSFWRVSSFNLPGSPESAVIARNRINDVVKSLPFDASEQADVMISVGEALTNAIKHGCKLSPNKRISIKCVAGPGRLVVDITDPGMGFNPDIVPIPSTDTLVEGGMGVYIMRELMDEVSFTMDGATTVRLVKFMKVPDMEEVSEPPRELISV